MRYALLAVLAFVLTAPLSGCLTLDMAHNRRHLRAVVQDLHELHQDIDKAFFGLDRYPGDE